MVEPSKEFKDQYHRDVYEISQKAFLLCMSASPNEQAGMFARMASVASNLFMLCLSTGGRRIGQEQADDLVAGALGDLAENLHKSAGQRLRINIMREDT
jgi:hypothetical protein